MNLNLAFISYESKFAPWGGIAPVMDRLPKAVQEASGLPTCVITPAHHRLRSMRGLEVDRVGEVRVPLDGALIEVDILSHEDSKSPHPWYFLAPREPALFAGIRHPYDLPSNLLLRDALFFGVAAARALQVIAPWAPWVLYLQDWEGAAVGLALASMGITHQMHLTLHNSYDAWPNEGDLARVGLDNRVLPGYSVLERVHGLVSKPLLSVSRQFGRDLTEDPLQHSVVAPHLQWLLRGSPVWGINHGPFIGFDAAEQLADSAREGGVSAVYQLKAELRQEAFAKLHAHRPSPSEPIWGDIDQLEKNDWPLFVMAGRDDPLQKGYDLLATAARSYLESGGRARFMFFPLPGDEGLEGLRFLADLSWDHPESVMVLPFRWKAGYMSVVRGAAFGVMPSLYEPFGAANEIALSGTACLARATGGLLEQIVPLRGIPSFNHSVEWRAESYHHPHAAPTGILFREYDGISSGVDDLRGIQRGGYATGPWHPNRCEQRLQFETFRGMALSLRQAISDAVDVYENRPQRYTEMVLAGIEHLCENFSWARAADGYLSTL